MKGQVRKFRDGEVIFSEGDASQTAFEITSGQVELAKKAGLGGLHLAILGTGEIFGEIGILDDGQRTATATAVGAVKVTVITRADFLRAIRDDPKVAADILEKLARRLRRADEMLVQGNAPLSAAGAAAPRGAPGGGGFWSRLLGLGAMAGRKHTIDIAVARLAGDAQDLHGKMLVDVFAGIEGVGARTLGRELAPEPGGDMAAQLVALTETGRDWLSNAKADLLIWGAVTEDGQGMRLRFLSAVEDDIERPGVFVTANWLDLPTQLDEHLTTLVQAVACAAVVPVSDPQLDVLKEVLPERLTFLKPMAKRPPLDFERESQAGLQVCLATAHAALFYVSGDFAWAESACDIYEDAARALERSQARLEGALVAKRLGVLIGMLAEGETAPDDLRTAAQLLRNALEALNVEVMPLEWAGANLRLGSLLYRLDSKLEAEGALLREAATSYRDALTVYTAAATPYKWAEAKNNLAQVLQILGGQQRSVELLQRAVDCGLDALQVRTREAMPQQWAATQNNVGSAYFLLARLTEDAEHLDGAEAAFCGARDVYRALGGIRQAQVAERNLARVADLTTRVEVDRPQPATKFDWDDQPSAASDPADPQAKRPDGAPEATTEIDMDTPRRKTPRALDPD